MMCLLLLLLFEKGLCLPASWIVFLEKLYWFGMKYIFSPLILVVALYVQFLWNRDYRSAVADNATAKNNNEAEQDRNYSSSTMASSMESMPPMPDPTHIPHATALSDWSPGGDLADGEDAAVVAAAAAAAAEAVDEEVGSTGGGSSTGPPLLAMPPVVLKDSPTQPKRLTKERKEKLDAIGFVWSLRNKRIDDHWDEMFRQVRVVKMDENFAV